MSDKQLESFREEIPELGWTELFTAYRKDDGEIVKHGQFRQVAKDGTVIEEGELRHGFRSGTWREYYENGQLSSAGTYDNGEPCGVHRSWFENGVVKFEWTYAAGCRHGIQLWYWNSGQIRELSHYEFDVQSGECKSWNEHGELLAVGIYRNDTRWQGTFLIQPPMEADHAFPTFNDYVDRFLNRGFVIAEFSNGEYVRIVEDSRIPFVPREPRQSEE